MEDVIKRYANERLALDHLNFNVKKGEVLGLLGPNGAGKTTAIKSIVGLIDIDDGTIRVFGESHNGKNQAVKRRIGLVTQEVTIYEDLSAYENLRFFGRLYGLKGDHLQRRIDAVAQLIGLEGRLKEKPKRFSGGMKRRLNIGCALLHEPELLIMDEPTVGIDPQSRHYILEFVKTLAKDTGTSILYTSHYIEEVEAIAERIAIIDQGHIIAEGSLDTLIAKIKGDRHTLIKVEVPDEGLLSKIEAIPDVKEATLQDDTYHIVTPPGVKILDRLITILASHTILNVSDKQPNLEDVFLMLTGKSLRDGEVT
ncbi:MAG: ABC transporter ATP-binding protein [Bacillota bacterium]